MNKMQWNLVALAVILVACALFFRRPPVSSGWSLTIRTQPVGGSLPAEQFTVFSDGRTIRQSLKSHTESPVFRPEALPALEAALRNLESDPVSPAESQEVWELQMDGTTRRLAAKADSPAYQKARSALKDAVSSPLTGPEWWMSLSQREYQSPWESRVFQVSYLGWATVTYNRHDGSSWSINVARVQPPQLQALYGRFKIHPLDGSSWKSDDAYSLALMANRRHCSLVCPDGHFTGPAAETQALLENCFPHSGRLLDQPWSETALKSIPSQ